jgi:hypothetical protein
MFFERGPRFFFDNEFGALRKKERGLYLCNSADYFCFAVPEEKEALLSGQLSKPTGLFSTDSTPRSTPRTTPSRSKSPSMPSEYKLKF